MQARRLKKHICQHSSCKTNEQQRRSSDFEWQPENEYKIKIGHNKLVQWRDLVQHKNLDEQDQHEPDDIFEE
jgi:hypothetical protein